VRSTLRVLSVGTIGFLMIATSSFAHHTWAVDSTRSITVKGTVTGVNWANPHVQIFVDSKDNNGNVVKWTVGGPSPSRMEGTGWNKNTLKAGDEITAVGQRATDAPNLLKTSRVVLSSGKELVAYGGN
jgi:hypothetical protein